jgi:hypothetical protein
MSRVNLTLLDKKTIRNSHKTANKWYDYLRFKRDEPPEKNP